MTKLKRLQKEALKSCIFRGHKMKRFEQCRPYVGIRVGTSYAECKVCGKSVLCNARPEPNQIEIGGEAVASNCIS